MDEAFHTAWNLIKSRARGNGREITSVVPSEEMDDQTWEDWAWEDLHEPTSQFHGEEAPEEEEEVDHEDAAVRHMLDSGMTPSEIAEYNLRMDSKLPAAQGQKPAEDMHPEPEDVPEERSITNEELARLLGLD
jgi:hypothetical protein